jgi:hypothetical protein
MLSCLQSPSLARCLDGVFSLLQGQQGSRLAPQGAYLAFRDD